MACKDISRYTGPRYIITRDKPNSFRSTEPWSSTELCNYTPELMVNLSLFVLHTCPVCQDIGVTRMNGSRTMHWMLRGDNPPNQALEHLKRLRCSSVWFGGLSSRNKCTGRMIDPRCVQTVRRLLCYPGVGRLSSSMLSPIVDYMVLQGTRLNIYTSIFRNPAVKGNVCLTKYPTQVKTFASVVEKFCVFRVRTSYIYSDPLLSRTPLSRILNNPDKF